MKRHLAVVLGLAPTVAGCALFGRSEDAPEGARSGSGVQVVSSDGEFDPSEAVDDLDDEDLGRGSVQEPLEQLEAQRQEREEGASEIAAQRAAKRQRVEAADANDADDDRAKTRLASNPQPEELRTPEEPLFVLADYFLEASLLALLAVALAGGAALVRWLLVRGAAAGRRGSRSS